MIITTMSMMMTVMMGITMMDDGDANFEEPECLPAAAAGQRSSRLQNRV